MEVKTPKDVLLVKKAEPVGKELGLKQKKIWMSVFFSTGILIIGLVVAILVVINTRDSHNNNCTTIDDLTEEEVEEYEQQVVIEAYGKIQEAIAKVINASADKGEKTTVSTYQYYISQTENTVVKNMLRSELLNIEMAYDTEKTRGDELIAVAMEIDDEMRSINSAGLIMILAEYYGKTDIYDEYAAILEERTLAKGMTIDGGEG